jgi:tRNA threonylcarbamoyladenosine dehydratase
MPDRFHRTHILVGDLGMRRLAAARILVVGLGAVGSFAVEALARSGVGHLTLVDSDSVSESNCNRQLYALTSTLGRAKADLARERVADINPNCHVESRILFADAKTLPRLFAEPFDIVIDAIDSLGPKVELISAALRAGVPIFSSMGAARRRDPSAIRVADIAETSICPLARDIRKRLHRRGLTQGVTCVFSTEAPTKTTFVPPTPDDFPSHGRPRVVMGSLPTMTGLFGLTLAHAVIEELLATPPKE